MSGPTITEAQREEAKGILALLMRGTIYRDEAIDKLYAVLNAPPITNAVSPGYDYSGMAWYIDRMKTTVTFNDLD